MLLRRLSIALVLLGALLALWPVKADATRYELEVRSGGQSLPQLQARYAEAEQRPFLERRPSCGIPLLAPITYTQDSALRGACAGPNARSMSLSVLALATGWRLAYGTWRSRRATHAEPVGVS